MTVTFVSKFDGAGGSANYEQFTSGTADRTFPVPAGGTALVFVATSAYNNGTGTTTAHTVTGSGLTWSQVGSDVVSAPFAGGNFQRLSLWATSSPSAQTVTASAKALGNAGSESYAVWALVFSGVGGIGAVGSGRGTSTGSIPTANITTTQVDSTVAFGLFNDANSTAPRTWANAAGTFTQDNYYIRNYAWGSGHYAAAGPAGAKVVGQTSPTSRSYGYCALAVELLAAGEPPAPSVEPGRWLVSP